VAVAPADGHDNGHGLDVERLVAEAGA